MMDKSATPTQAPDSSKEGSASSRVFLWGGVAMAVVALVVFRKAVFAFAADFIGNVVPLFFTPVILETTLFIIGLCIVLVWNQSRRKKDEVDEWVYLSQVDPETELEEVPDSLKTRAGESVFKEGAVGEIDERSMMLDRIEGYIDLGMFDEASEALLELTEGGGENAVDVLRLRYLLCAKQHGVDEAAKLLEDWRREGFVADDWNPDAP